MKRTYRQKQDLKTIKLNAYIFPVINKIKSGGHNPYIDNFIDSTGNYINYLNENKPSSILSLPGYLHKIDHLFLNWAEDLPDNRGGLFQSLIFLALLRIIKLFRIKVVWTLHNKFSHSSQKLFLKKLLFLNLLKRSDVIITHSTEGIRFAESLCPGVTSRIFYFPHPIVPVEGLAERHNPKKYDILIWGSIAPYKAVDIFLEFMAENYALDKYKILIAGKATSPDFYNKIKKFESGNISIRNQFIGNEELKKLIQQSKVVLFTYSGKSVLSSGALIDSISYGAKVIGPNFGAFSELGRAGIIKNYDNYDDLMVILEQSDQFVISDKLHDYIYAHTWSEFSRSFEKIVLPR